MSYEQKEVIIENELKCMRQDKKDNEVDMDDDKDDQHIKNENGNL